MKPSRPRRATDERPLSGRGCRTASDAIMRIRPHPLRFSSGSASSATFTCVSRLPSIASRYSEISKLSTGPNGTPPEFVTTTSSPPSSSAVCCTHSDARRSERRSRGVLSTAPGPIVLTSTCAPASRSGSRPQIETSAPSLASDFATARPSPLLDAATSATRPSSPRSMSAHYPCGPGVRRCGSRSARARAVRAASPRRCRDRGSSVRQRRSAVIVTCRAGGDRGCR